MLDAAALLSRREANLRSAATACLVGIALVQAIGLPFLLRQEPQLAVLSIATMAVCVGLGLMLAATTAETARQLWRASPRPACSCSPAGRRRGCSRCRT